MRRPNEGARISRDGQRLSYFALTNNPDGTTRPEAEKFIFRYFDFQSGLALSGFANDINAPKVVKATCHQKCRSPREWTQVINTGQRASFLISVYKYAILNKVAPYKQLGDNTEFRRLESLIGNLTDRASRLLTSLLPTGIDVMIFVDSTAYANAWLQTYQGCRDLKILSAIDYSNWRNLQINMQEKAIYFSNANAPYTSGVYRYNDLAERGKYLEMQSELETVLARIEKFHREADQTSKACKDITSIIAALTEYKLLLK